MFEGEATQIAFENKQDCVCIQATKDGADKIINLFNLQLEKETDPTDSEVEKKFEAKQYPLRHKHSNT